MWKFYRWPQKNIREPLPSSLKQCVSFHSHPWIQNGVTVQKYSIWVKMEFFFTPVTLKFDGWPWKTIGHFFYATSSFLHNCVAICEFKLELQSRNTQMGAQFVLTSLTLTFDLWPWPFAWTSLLAMAKLPENFTMIRWKKHNKKGVTDGQTETWTDWTIRRAAWSQLKFITIISWNLSYMSIPLLQMTWWHRMCETSTRCMRSTDPTLGIRQLFCDDTKGQ